jgi:hypothetical protein
LTRFVDKRLETLFLFILQFFKQTDDLSWIVRKLKIGSILLARLSIKLSDIFILLLHNRAFNIFILFNIDHLYRFCYRQKERIPYGARRDHLLLVFVHGERFEGIYKQMHVNFKFWIVLFLTSFLNRTYLLKESVLLDAFFDLLLQPTSSKHETESLITENKIQKVIFIYGLGKIMLIEHILHLFQVCQIIVNSCRVVINVSLVKDRVKFVDVCYLNQQILEIFLLDVQS